MPKLCTKCAARLQTITLDLPLSTKCASTWPVSVLVSRQSEVQHSSLEESTTFCNSDSDTASSATSSSSIRHLEFSPPQGLFEWDERRESPGEEGTADGMAILVSQGGKAGYLGKPAEMGVHESALT
jgi:hypothetical protein